MRRARRSRGAAAVEMALLLPMLVLIILGLLDYGWYFFVALRATNAAREGARIATTIAGSCPNGTALALGRDGVNTYLGTLGSWARIDGSCDMVDGAPSFKFVVDLSFPRLTGSRMVPMPSAPGFGSDYTRARGDATMRGVP